MLAKVVLAKSLLFTSWERRNHRVWYIVSPTGISVLVTLRNRTQHSGFVCILPSLTLKTLHFVCIVCLFVTL